MFAQIYLCPKHGEVWHTEIVEDIDTENDEVYPHRVCSYCYSDVTEMLHDGKPCLHALTGEEIFWEMENNHDDEDDEDDDNDDSAQWDDDEIPGSFGTHQYHDIG